MLFDRLEQTLSFTQGLFGLLKLRGKGVSGKWGGKSEEKVEN